MSSVAIIGAGPSGLACARWLKNEGFEPVLFEQSDRIGGQWSGDRRCSGIWPSMHVNTWREMTQFSDLVHEAGTPLYPSNRTMTAYLARYAEKFDLTSRLRTLTRVVGVEREADRSWRLSHVGPDGTRSEEVHRHVVVASGRFNEPLIPAVPGLASFAGSGGAIHSFDYRGAESYVGKRVLVAGCSISALEIASELAMAGAARVVSANRRQRYVVPKMVAGLPIECHLQSRLAAFAHDALPKDQLSAELKEFFASDCGVPERYGAPTADENVFVAGVTQCQHYLPLVAEGRIDVRPWIDAIDGETVRFADGTGQSFDAIIFGTGFKLYLPFLSDGLRQLLGADGSQLDLHKLTFHPDLPGLAFAGLFQVNGPYLPPIEAQARWIAYVWGGARIAPSREEMEAGIAECRASRRDKHHMAVLTTLFAREAGVEPTLSRWPLLLQPLLFGPLLPASLRLCGRDSLHDAPWRVLKAALPPPDPAETVEQILRLQGLAVATGPSTPYVLDALAAARMFIEAGSHLAIAADCPALNAR